MKNLAAILLLAILFSGCAAPRYSYYDEDADISPETARAMRQAMEGLSTIRMQQDIRRMADDMEYYGSTRIRPWPY